jgi:hypothetical protein
MHVDTKIKVKTYLSIEVWQALVAIHSLCPGVHLLLIALQYEALPDLQLPVYKIPGCVTPSLALKIAIIFASCRRLSTYYVSGVNLI